VVIGTEAVKFLFWEYIIRNFFAVWVSRALSILIDAVSKNIMCMTIDHDICEKIWNGVKCLYPDTIISLDWYVGEGIGKIGGRNQSKCRH
jgi:hypothetical protein